MGKHHRGRQHACKHNGEPVQIPITPTPDPGQYHKNLIYGWLGLAEDIGQLCPIYTGANNHIY